VPDRTVRTEFSILLGLMMKHPVDFGLPTPQDMQAHINRTRTLLAELHERLGQPMLDAIAESLKRQQAGPPVDEAAIFTRGDVIREAIFYGGESAYSFQYRDFALQRYAKDNPWLCANKGFWIEEAHAVVRAIVDLANRKVGATLSNTRRLDPPQWTLLPGFSFSLQEIVEAAKIAPAAAEAVLAAFTAPEPPTNAGFKSLGDFNAANACPILLSPDGGYISLQTYGVAEALYDSPFYWMAADKTYKDTAFANRGAFTEDLVAKRLSVIFGNNHVHRNVYVMRKGAQVTEADVLVLFAGRAMVVQCKSKKLTLEARKGNDLQLRDDFKKSVQDAYDQAYLCAAWLGDPDLKFVGGDGREISIPALREIYPVCVVSDHYPALTVQAREFLNFQTDKIIQPPFVADVFLIDVLAEMLASPLRLLSYLTSCAGCSPL
jgi:Nuclease-related domain